MFPFKNPSDVRTPDGELYLLATTAGRLFRCVFAAGYGIQIFLELGKPLTVDGVMLPLSILVGGNQAALPQHLHVVGQRWLGHLQFLQQVAAAFFPLGQHLNNPEPVGVRHCFADLGYFFSCHALHLISISVYAYGTLYIDVCQYKFSHYYTPEKQLELIQLAASIRKSVEQHTI